MNFTKINDFNRTSQFELAQFPNNFVRVSDMNDLIFVLNNLNTLLPNYADDAASAAGGIPVGGLYRTTSTVKVRIS